MIDRTYELGDLADRITGGNVVAMAKMLNDAGAKPPVAEIDPDPATRVPRLQVIDLYAHTAGRNFAARVAAVLRQ